MSKHMTKYLGNTIICPRCGLIEGLSTDRDGEVYQMERGRIRGGELVTYEAKWEDIPCEPVECKE